MENPHVLAIPHPAQGHVIPLMELAQCLVQHGIKVTFVNTETNHKWVVSALAETDCVGDQIRLVSIPDGSETLEDKKDLGELTEAMSRVMPGKLEELIKEINSLDNDKITCMVADQSIGWALEVAAKMGIRRAAFCPAAAAMLIMGFSIPKLIEEGIIDKYGETFYH